MDTISVILCPVGGSAASVRGKLTKPAREAFKFIGPTNPLAGLDESGRMYLYALLYLYERAVSDPEGDDAWDDAWESAAKTAAEGARLAARLEDHIFRNPIVDLGPFVSRFAGLPQQLKDLSTLMNLNGKPGRKRELHANHLLVMASVFVQLRLGSFFDEHIAELFQAIGNRDMLSDFTGDAIRKKRKYLKREYPALYAQAIKMVERASQR